uniref:Uncharacterized protein n=1 Tax=Oryza punctata TaxID=4537 RepID=A0A0E0M536_ORYPU
MNTAHPRCPRCVRSRPVNPVIIIGGTPGCKGEGITWCACFMSSRGGQQLRACLLRRGYDDGGYLAVWCDVEVPGREASSCCVPADQSAGWIFVTCGHRLPL